VKQDSRVRPPAVAGMFYPGLAGQLEAQVSEFLDVAQPEKLQDDIVALVSPHAGYVYSGPTAANGYKLLEKRRFETVVIVSPSHREYFDGISLYGGSAYRTPMGDTPLDVQLREQITEGERLIVVSDAGHRSEHAIEVQLPFLQKVLGDFQFLPVVMGDQRRELCFLLGHKLAQVLVGRKALLIASTDLSHFHPYSAAVERDKRVIDLVGSFDYEGLMTDLELEKAEACGGGPTVAVMLAARELGADRVVILHHCNSGDVTGDRSGVVGYLSAAIVKTAA